MLGVYLNVYLCQQKKNMRFASSSCKKLLRVVTAVSFLHGKKMVHRDIKSTSDRQVLSQSMAIPGSDLLEVPTIYKAYF